MNKFFQMLSRNISVIKYGLITGLVMILALFLTMSGPFAEQAWPKFIVPVITAGGILLYLKSEFDRRKNGLSYFRALKVGFGMATIAFLAFSIVLYFVLRDRNPYWLSHLHAGPFFMTVFCALTGIFMNFVMVLMLLPLFKKKHFRFRNEKYKIPEEAG